ncbi:hypothetical protein NUH86_07010 [Sphingobium sp. JS3065]|uniref:hypothetical protein n=1 Tax=Sphingobium sp. JS3065 TaxID=2970925 RepID=UPI0022655008|nr:hypothetical protein [Sphingobium sp. JS3065]UZW56505.1 hypothetical protein NUH86_07010 [Sphingobium sp. JS3065]
MSTTDSHAESTWTSPAFLDCWASMGDRPMYLANLPDNQNDARMVGLQLARIGIGEAREQRNIYSARCGEPKPCGQTLLEPDAGLSRSSCRKKRRGQMDASKPDAMFGILFGLLVSAEIWCFAALVIALLR